MKGFFILDYNLWKIYFIYKRKGYRTAIIPYKTPFTFYIEATITEVPNESHEA